MKSKFVFRTRVIYFFILAISLVFISKLFLVQVVHSETYKERADRQYYAPPDDMFERGNIFMQNKDGELISAGLQATGYKLTINPTKIVDPEGAYLLLNYIVPLERENFISKAEKENDPYEEIIGELTKEQADKINELKIPGVSLYKEKWRFYPGGRLASHALGFVAYKGDELAGRYGLEREYEDVLARNKNNPYVNFFAEVFANIDSLIHGEEEEGDLITTIEPSVQAFFEKTLENTKDKYSVDSIGGIIMDPRDGSIYAMTSKPDFDLNNFSSEKSSKVFSNPIVENVFEFGSVVKPIVAAAGIDKGVITANTKYNDKGSVWVEDKEIFNFDKKARGVVTMQEVLSQSLNTGMVFIAEKLGKKDMLDYMLSFGIDEKTGIDLPNETSGLVSNLKNSPRELEYANAAFGQGIALTPIEMVRALAALGNGGKLVTPHLVEKIKYASGLEKVLEYETKQTKISPETSEEITRMLVNIMDQAIEGGARKLEHHSVAVKTGTAQVANTTEGGYYKDRHTHSFFGYFPAYDPQFIVFLYAVNPKGTQYASQTWVSPFTDLSKFLINYYEVAPDR